MQKIDVVKHILSNTSQSFVNSAGGSAWAPSNVALCKYWGKRDVELNLPVTSSLSISLGHKGTFTRIKEAGNADQYFVNGVLVNPNSKFAERLKKFLDLFRSKDTNYLVTTNTNVPIAAGFASSACGFASLVQALDQLYDWRLNKKDLSILARLGSGSACRSLYTGFVEWQRGNRPDGMDSYGVQLEYVWPELRIGMLTISTEEKPISSSEAMQRTLNTSRLYADWPSQVKHDLKYIKLALSENDFMLFGTVAEGNAMIMHGTMYGTKPPIRYSLPETMENINKVHKLSLAGLPLFYTQDAGPNLQLLFLVEDEKTVLREFPELEVVVPFADSNSERVVLVNEHDVTMGSSEKLPAHAQGELHRAFSVFILRERDGGVEVLLQKRSAVKYHSANLWSNSCCGHPRPGEDIIAAAKRRLLEEMGFAAELKEIGKFHYKEKFSDVDLIENEIDHVLVGYSDLNELPFNPLEVQDFCWIKLEDLKRDLQINPNKYTIWLESAFNLVEGV